MYKYINEKELATDANKNEQKWKKYFAKNKKKLEKGDLIVHSFHVKASAHYNCLSCANCCRTLGPRISDKDIERMAKALRMKANVLIDTYLHVDEDGDTVFKGMPCPFLGSDNYCSIYEARPKACREYPHTDRKKFAQIFPLSIKNASTCPIVYQVLEDICEEIV